MLLDSWIQGRYDAKTDEYREGESPTQVPFEVA